MSLLFKYPCSSTLFALRWPSYKHRVIKLMLLDPGSLACMVIDVSDIDYGLSPFDFEASITPLDQLLMYASKLLSMIIKKFIIFFISN